MKIIEEIEIKHIILDCSCMNYIDSQGINAIIQVNNFMFLNFIYFCLITFIYYKSCIVILKMLALVFIYHIAKVIK